MQVSQRERMRQPEVCPHDFRAAGITSYLYKRRKAQVAQQMAAPESARTTGPMIAATRRSRSMTWSGL